MTIIHSIPLKINSNQKYGFRLRFAFRHNNHEFIFKRLKIKQSAILLPLQ